MTSARRTVGASYRLIVVMGVALAISGCAWQPYVVTRSIRYATGVRTRFHPITPLASSLKAYRVIEMKPLDNLLPGHVPPRMEEYLDQQIMNALQGLASSPTVVRSAEDDIREADVTGANGSIPTLVVEGYLDDYDPGSVPLRVVELGFNHVAVTVRLRLRDKQSGQILGAASITTEDNRATGTTKAAIDHLAKRIRTFVGSGYGG